MAVRFTKGELDFLAHRFALPDALCEVLADDEDDAVAMATTDYAAFEQAVTHLHAICERGLLDPAKLSPLDSAILRDVIEGSTYIACFDAVDPKSRHPQDIAQRRTQAACLRSARSAVRKLRAAGFETADAPEV